MADVHTACPTLVAAMSGPIESTINTIFNEYGWDETEALNNLVRLSETLGFYEIECIPPLGQGALAELRVFRKKSIVGIDVIICREVADGESSSSEFKSSLAYDRDKSKFKPGLEPRDYLSASVIFSALKTVNAFLNSHGGTLFIGVKDDGTFCGVEDDYVFIKRPEQQFDGWELYFRDLIEAYFLSGRAANAYVAIQKAIVSGVCVARVQVAPRSQLTFMRWEKQVLLYVRSGNRSIPVPFEDIEQYFDLRKRY